MKKLHKLFITSYVGPFVITLSIVLFFLVMQFLWKYMDDLIGKGLELNLIFKLLFYASANLVPMALPLAVLLASIMTFGTFAENYELVSIKSAGISLQKSLTPLIVLSTILAISSFFFMNNIWPIANLKMKTLLYDITHKKPALDIKEKVYYKEIDGYVIRVERKGKDQQKLYGISIYDHTDHEGNSKIIRADSGKMSITKDSKHMIFELHNGTSFNEMESDNADQNNFPVVRTAFKKEKVLFDMSSFELQKTDEDLFKDNYEMLSLRQLSDEIDTAEQRKGESLDKFNRYVTEQTYLFKDSNSKAPTSIDKSAINTTDSTFIALALFKKQEQQKVVQNALKLARNAKSYAQSSVNNLEQQETRINRYKIEWHRKFSIAYMSLILFFVGAPLGAITKKGGLGLPVMISIIFFIFYYVITITGEKLIKQGTLDAFEGMWLAPFILTPIAFFLTYKATRDSKLFNFI